LKSFLRLLESRWTFGNWGDFWRVRGLLESGETFGKPGDFWKVKIGFGNPWGFWKPG
jgi:hypothetical protein